MARQPLLAFLLLCVLPAAAAAEPEYSTEGARACIDCHETASVMGIRDTVHAKASDPRTPAAQKECQSCHGPSARHMQFPMQIENLHFGTTSKTSPNVQNQMCLSCHEGGARENWHASAHGFDDVVCSTCHSVHDPDQIVPAKATQSAGCSAAGCHAELMGSSLPAEFSHTLECSACHNPHAPLNSERCVECHSQTPEVLAKQSPKAKRFHEVSERKGTDCMRCHKGIAHPIPPLALSPDH